MSRFGAKKGRKLPGSEFTWDNADPNGEPDTAPTPLFPKYAIPRPRSLSAREQIQVDLYRTLRERFHDGPYYSILGASSGANGVTSARANFDPFHGMPSYSGKYQKKKRLVPKVQGRPYVMKFFPRELWPTVQPNFKPDSALDGYVVQGAPIGQKRGFEDDDEDDDAAKRQRQADEEEGEGMENEDVEGNILEADEDAEEEIVDDDFEDDEDEMGGDYNAEQYFDGGDDEYGDDGFGDGGGGGGDEDTF